MYDEEFVNTPLPYETQEDVDYNRCLQLAFFRDCIKGNTPYQAVGKVFSDVLIREEEYNNIMRQYRKLSSNSKQQAANKLLNDFMIEKGFHED